ncbi:MAG: hypothetical protein IJZ16_00275 [Clostridia bacterium]|nr:hypothetical protein [Clostridia bacterium]
MKKSLFKKILAISLAFATLTFAGCQNNEPVVDDNPSENISQNVDEETSQEVESTDKNETESTKQEESSQEIDKNQSSIDDIMGVGATAPTVMKETIDLKSIDLKKYGLTDDNDISVPYPTSLGCAYVVRDYGKAEEQTYLFVTTKDKVMYLNTEFPSAGRIPVEEAHSLSTGDLDSEKGEEIVLLANTGGNGGAGIFCNGIYKISNGKIIEMKISNEEPFKVSLEAPYTVVFKNKKLNFEEKIVCDSDYESLFDDNGNPEVEEYDGGFYAPHSANVYCYDDEIPKVSFTSYSYLSRSMNDKEVYSSVDYVYDSKINEFVISDVSVWASEIIDNNHNYDEIIEIEGYINGYTYCDINKDGVEELITQTGSCEADRTYHIYTFADGKMFYAGSFGGWHGTLYEKDDMIIIASSGPTENGFYVTSVTYELIDNELVKKDTFEKEFTDDAEWEKYFEDLEKSSNVLVLNNIYYK